MILAILIKVDLKRLKAGAFYYFEQLALSKLHRFAALFRWRSKNYTIIQFAPCLG